GSALSCSTVKSGSSMVSSEVRHRGADLGATEMRTIFAASSRGGILGPTLAACPLVHRLPADPLDRARPTSVRLGDGHLPPSSTVVGLVFGRCGASVVAGGDAPG